MMTLGIWYPNCIWQSLMIFILLVLYNFIKNLDLKSEIFKRQASRPV